MNIAGPLASLIFAITVLTVFGGLFAYGVYKARERTRAKPSATKKALQYFVEYALPVAAGEGAAGFGSPKAAAKEGRPWGLYFISFMAISGLIAAVIFYYRSGKRLVLQGAWQGGAGVEFPEAPTDRPKPPRGPQVSLAKLAQRPASKFPKPSFDANHDENIDGKERVRIQTEVPLTILVTVDDNGHAQGMKWLLEAFDRYGVSGKATFFFTGNYANKRPSHLGSDINLWWTLFSNENFVGLHGLTTDPTNKTRESWEVARWLEEHNGAMSEVQKVKPPAGWSWDQYPWGSRAPYLFFNDGYFAALEKVTPRIQYDASMIWRPARTDLPTRDVLWPFSLEMPIPVTEIELPFSEIAQKRFEIGKHPGIIEVPVASWLIKKDNKPTWIPPLDDNFFKEQGCVGDGPNLGTVEVFEQNLKAHYTGNRGPFHLGLHAQNYMADKKCQRATVEALLAKVQGLIAAKWQIQYESIPRLLEWMSKD